MLLALALACVCGSGCVVVLGICTANRAVGTMSDHVVIDMTEVPPARPHQDHTERQYPTLVATVGATRQRIVQAAARLQEARRRVVADVGAAAGRVQATKKKLVASATTAATKAAVARAETLEDLVDDALTLSTSMGGWTGLYVALNWAKDHATTCAAVAYPFPLLPGMTPCGDFVVNSWRATDKAKSIYELLCVADKQEAETLQVQLGAQLELTLFDNLFQQAQSNLQAGVLSRKELVDSTCRFITANARATFTILVQNATSAATTIAQTPHDCGPPVRALRHT